MKSVLLAACALAALVPAAALAETPDDAEAAVSSVIVTARRNADDPSVVAEARKRLSETPGAVSVISQEAYASRQALALDDMLRDAPGVYAQRKWGGDVRISIRGSGIGNASHNRGLLLAQDGVPLNEADGYGDSQIADPLNTRYAEVYRGGNALRFGGALLGGAINMVTPTGKDAGFDARLRVDGGSFGLIREHAAIAGQSGDWDLYAAATNQTSQGWRSQSQQNIQFATLNLGRSFGEDREVRLIAQAADIKQDMPGSLTLEEALNTPRKAAASALSGDQARDLTVKRLTLQTRWRFNESTLFEGAVWGWEKSLYHPIFQVMDQDSATRGAFARIDWTGHIGGLRADAFYGFSLRDGEVEALRYVNLAGQRGAKTADARQNASGLDVFAEGRLFVADQLALVAGGSWGRATRDYLDRMTPANNASRDYEWFSPRMGLLWEAENGAQVFANLTRSVEPPTYGALVQAPLTGFTPVEVQDAWTGEIGTRGRHGALAWDLVAYRSHIEGEMLNFITSPDIPAATFNAKKTIHQGVEAGLDWTLPVELADGSLMLRQVYNWSDFRFDGDARWGDKRLPVVPEHQYRAELTWRHPAGVFVTPSVEWRMSSPYVDYANTMKAPDYAVLGLTGGFNINARTSVYIDARNLTDKRYVGEFSAVTDASKAQTGVFFPGEGRSVFVGLRLAY